MKLPEELASAKELGTRFNLIGLLPTTGLVLLVIGLLVSGLPSSGPDPGKIFTAIGDLSGAQIAAVLLGILLLSLILYPFQLSLVRLLEGYWEVSAVGDALAAIGVELQRRRLEEIKALAVEEVPGPDDSAVSIPGGTATVPATELERRRGLAREQFATYPAEGRLLPTRLGNVLRAAEDEAGQRYGLDTITMMPRLYPFLSERLTDGLAELRDQLDITARLCVTLLLATVISALLLLPQLLLHGWWLALPVATAVLAWVAYKAAVQAATAYGRLLYVAFDLHRFDMVRGLHLPLPNAGKEEDFNQRLSEFFAKRRWVRYVDPAEYRYEHPSDLTTTPTNTLVVELMRRSLPVVGAAAILALLRSRRSRAR
jgi:hypothetical protein